MSGGHLLHLAVAGCIFNDLYYVAAQRGIQLTDVRVCATGGFEGEATTVSTGMSYRVAVTGNASEEELRDLVATAVGLDAALIRDVGVAGIHRLVAVAPELRTYHAVIVVAGMEAALASVVGGLVACPVIAVPTSVGYGASFEGVTALLGMLTSCAAGLTVVNIDAGYSAAMAAYRLAYATPQARTEDG